MCTAAGVMVAQARGTWTAWARWVSERAHFPTRHLEKPGQLAVGQNQWYHFGVGVPPILVYSGVLG